MANEIQVDAHAAYTRPRLGAFAFLFLVTILFMTNPVGVKAQEPAREWAPPINLSNSGSTTDPVLVLGPRGYLYVFWLDSFVGFRYSYGDGSSWSAPQRAEMPSNLRNGAPGAVFISDSYSRIYVFWTNLENTLSFAYTSVTADGSLGPWYSGTPNFSKVVNYRVTTDANGNIHLIYMLGEDKPDQPAGVYYLKMNRIGEIISRQTLEQSPYFRSLSDRQTAAETGNSDPGELAVFTYEGEENIIVVTAWSNRLTKKLSFRQSLDSGLTWMAAQELLSPLNFQSEEAFPAHPVLSKIADQLVLFWQAQQGATSCVQNVQYLEEGSSNWSDFVPLDSDRTLCPNLLQLNGSQNDAVLFSVRDFGVNIQRWNGASFSSGQYQDELVSFLDADTFANVQLGCQRSLLAYDQLFVVGCGTTGSKDTWLTSRPIDAILDHADGLFEWSTPKTVAQSPSRVESLTLVSGGLNNLDQAFWSQPDGFLRIEPATSIMYTSWVEPQFQKPTTLFSATNGKVNQLSVTQGNDGRMYLVWSGGKSGKLFFSWAATGRASSEVDWSSPVEIPSTRPSSAQPKVVLGNDGTIYIAYLIPYNEDRGVYSVRSNDRGLNWTTPVRVFDAVSEGCDVVDQLSFDVSIRGTLHLGWTCSTIPGGVGPYAFRHARSTDGGESWAVTPFDLERAVVWGQVIYTSDGVHRIWQEVRNNRLVAYDQLSIDDGLSWLVPYGITSSESQYGPIGLAEDSSGQLYLIQPGQESRNMRLDFWYWDGTDWLQGENPLSIEGRLDQIEGLSAAVTQSGKLAVLYAYRNIDQLTNLSTTDLVYINYPLQIRSPIESNGSTQPQADVTAVATPTPVVEPSEPPQPTPTIDVNAISKDAPGFQASNTIIYVVVIALSLLMVSSVFVYQVIKRTRRE